MWKSIGLKGAALRKVLVLSFALTVGTATLPTSAQAQFAPLVVVDTRCIGSTCCTWATISALFYTEEFFLGCTTAVATTAPAANRLFAARIRRPMSSRRPTEQEVPSLGDRNRGVTTEVPDPSSA
jgi:Na+(H+)/acetate symporter ActP